MTEYSATHGDASAAATGSRPGLVMEGGGMRGIFTNGVIDVLLEHNVQFGCAVGVSAGACFGINIKSQQIGRALRYNVQMQGDPRYMSMRSWLTTGNYVNAEFCYHTLPDQLDVIDRDTYQRNPMPFYVVCTDADTGQPVYQRIEHLEYEDLEWVRASASLPIVSKPVCIGDKRLLDGGLSDSLPLRFAERVGSEYNLVILTQPRGFRKAPVHHPWKYRLLCGRYPAVVRCLQHRPDMYNAQLEYLESQERTGKTLLIAPPEPLNIGRIELNGDKLQHLYQLGRQACLAQLDQVLDFVAQHSVVSPNR